MARKLIRGLLISTMITLLPALGNLRALRVPQLWVLWMLGVLANLFQPAYTWRDASAPPEDRRTASQILWSVCATQLAAVLEALYARFPDSLRWDVTAWVALALAVGGLLLRTWAVLTLGGLFTWHIKVQAGQPVIRRGPYRFLRHPGYAGALLTCTFSAVFLHAWVSVGVSVVVLTAAFLRRIRHEEAFLRARLGDAYEVYCRDVPRLIPGLY